MTAEHILLQRDGAVARLVLDRAAKRNAITTAMWQRISAILAELEEGFRAGRGARCLILSSSSAEAFSAGADLDEFERAATDTAFRDEAGQALAGALQALRRSPLPSIAEVRGNCFGGGCALAAACDMRFADATARFAVTPAKVGLVYPLADTQRLVDLVGPAQARALLLTGEPVDAAEAARIGLVNDVLPAAELSDGVARVAATIAANAPYSLAALKRILALIEEGVRHDSKETRALFAGAYEAGDFREGLAAFREKRKPKFD